MKIKHSLAIVIGIILGGILSSLGGCASSQMQAPSGRKIASAQKLKISLAADSDEAQALEKFIVDANLPNTASSIDKEEAIFKAKIQAFALGESLIAEFDQLIEKGFTIEKISKSKGSSPNVYGQLLALRPIHEQIESAFHAQIVNSYNEAIDGGTDSVFFDRLRGKIQSLGAESSKHAEMVSLALSDFSDHIDRLETYHHAQDFSGLQSKDVVPQKSVVSALRSMRAKSKKDGFISYKNFEPKEGENGFRVASKVADHAKIHAKELIQLLQSSRDPSEDAPLKLFPSIGPTGNITGNGFPKGTWAMTFDDGPGATTPGVLQNLKNHNIKTTFFILSQEIDSPAKLPQTALQEKADGHAQGCHSYTHPQINKLGPIARRHEIDGAAQVFEKVIGFQPRYFRLPYGAGVSITAVRQDIVKSCMVHVFWNVDTLDWHDKDPELIYQRSIKQIDQLGRGVILFHDIHPQSVIASEKVMTYLQLKNQRFVTLPEIVDEINGGKQWTCTKSWPAQ